MRDHVGRQERSRRGLGRRWVAPGKGRERHYVQDAVGDDQLLRLPSCPAVGLTSSALAAFVTSVADRSRVLSCAAAAAGSLSAFRRARSAVSITSLGGSCRTVN